eukprot:4116265-Amphidinium_carterae.1
MLKAWVSLGSPDLTLTGIPCTSHKSKRCWIWCHTFHASFRFGTPSQIHAQRCAPGQGAAAQGHRRCSEPATSGTRA